MKQYVYIQLISDKDANSIQWNLPTNATRIFKELHAKKKNEVKPSYHIQSLTQSK